MTALITGARENVQSRHRLMTVRPAPRREPPFDDELPDDLTTVGRLDQPLPFAQPAPRAATVDVRPRSDPDLPDPTRWARSLLIGMIETANGHRAPHQLSALFSAVVGMRVAADLAAAAHRQRPHWMYAATVHSVRAMQPCPGVAEVTATLGVGQRVRAVALRAERRHGQWRCTRLQLG